MKSVYGDKYTYDLKSHLFDDLDNLAYRNGRLCTNRLECYLTENFEISREGRFEISKEVFETKGWDGDYCKVTRYLRSNALYIIYDEFGDKINLDEFIGQYVQSRGLAPRTKQRWCRDASTKRFQLRWKKSRYNGTSRSSGLKKEYKDAFYALEHSVKIRQKRFEVARMHHVFYYDDDEYCRNKTRSWKSHRKNQFR